MISDVIELIRPRSMVAHMPAGLFDEAFATGADWAPVQYSYYFAVARRFRPRRILEIGVLGGMSMASMLLGAGKTCSAVGWDTEGYRKESNKLARQTLNVCGVGGRAELRNINSQSQSGTGEVFDLIHVDGEHGYTGALHDLELALESGAGTILFDDIHNLSTDCSAAAKEFERRHRARICHAVLLPTTTGLMVYKLAP